MNSTRHSSLVQKDCAPWKGPMLMWEEPTLEKFMEILSPWEGPHTEARQECEKEGLSETMCTEVTAISIPFHHGRGGERTTRE